MGDVPERSEGLVQVEVRDKGQGSSVAQSSEGIWAAKERGATGGGGWERRGETEADGTDAGGCVCALS